MLNELLVGFDDALSGLLLTPVANCPCAYVVLLSVNAISDSNMGVHRSMAYSSL